jgi:hypothetical protein
MMSISLIRPLLVTRDGTEQSGMRGTVRPQVRLALPKPLYDLIAIHAALYTTKAARDRRQNGFHGKTAFILPV